MAMCSLRLRRAVSLASSLIKQQRLLPAVSAVSAPSSLSAVGFNPYDPVLDITQPHLQHLTFHSRSFRSSTISLSSRPRSPSFDKNTDEIGPDDILFEGCDYNHWLITMDFPKDPKPTPEEMVETYVQTCAKVVGSVEEAKKRIYACSTTTYQGFQVVVSEETSEKFKGLPGVVFVLPDSYIDPVNKEYGGDKYDNGVITPRPPPVQYGRQKGRYGDRNRDFNRPSQPRGQSPYGQGNSTYDNQGSMHGNARNYGAQQIPPPQQSYGSPGTGDGRYPMPMNNPPGGREYYQGDRRDPMPPYQANYNQGGRGNYYPQGQRDFPAGDQRANPPPGHRDFRGNNQNYAPPQGGTFSQGTGGAYNQGAGGTYGQGVGGAQGHEMGSGYGQSHPWHGEDQRPSQVEQRNNTQGEQRN